MARPKNDGKGRMGGRTKGTPNKITSATRQMIAKFIYRNSKKLQADFDELADPKDRLAIYERLLKYILPPQTVAKVELTDLTDEDIESVVTSLLNDIKQNGE